MSKNCRHGLTASTIHFQPPRMSADASSVLHQSPSSAFCVCPARSGDPARASAAFDRSDLQLLFSPRRTRSIDRTRIDRMAQNPPSLSLAHGVMRDPSKLTAERRALVSRIAEAHQLAGFSVLGILQSSLWPGGVHAALVQWAACLANTSLADVAYWTRYQCSHEVLPIPGVSLITPSLSPSTN